MPDNRGFHHGLYETHIPVTDIGRSVDFYVDKLGFEIGFGKRDDLSVLLLYPRGGRRWMLGLFEVDRIEHRHPAEFHFALRMSGSDVDEMVALLTARGIEPVHPPTAPMDGPMTEPIVHGWMPAASVFFRDPDGHLLELIAELDEEPRPEFAYRYLSEWRETSGS